jgi:3-dehydroquinate synthetase
MAVDGFSKRDPVRAEREFRAGIAEIIKTGAIWDLSLFEVCEQKVEMIQVCIKTADLLRLILFSLFSPGLFPLCYLVLCDVAAQLITCWQAREHNVLNEIVRRSVAIKAEVVTLVCSLR